MLIDNVPVHIVLEETAEKLDSIKELLPLNTTFLQPCDARIVHSLNVNIGPYLFSESKHMIICKMILQALLLLIRYMMH